MKLYFFSLLLLLSASALAQDLQTLVSTTIEEAQFAGVSAGYQIAGEEAVIASAGHRNLDQGLVYAPNTKGRIASITKSLTAVAILQLWERGLIDLDAPIQTYLPDYPVYPEGEITVRHLLHHTSGIGAYENRESENKTFYPTLAEAAQVFKNRPLLHPPGSIENYTSYGYVVLGMVLEAVSGQTYGAYLQEHIFTPAGMHHSGEELSTEHYDNKSEFYYRNRRGKIKKATPNDLSNRLPGGGLYATVGDLLHFGQALMDGRLIQDSTFALMQEHSGAEYDGNPYAMGVFLYGENPDWGKVIGHTGEQTGVSAMLFLMVDQQTSVAVMTNTALRLQDASNLAVMTMQLAYRSISEE